MKLFEFLILPLTFRFVLDPPDKDPSFLRCVSVCVSARVCVCVCVCNGCFLLGKCQSPAIVCSSRTNRIFFFLSAPSVGILEWTTTSSAAERPLPSHPPFHFICDAIFHITLRLYYLDPLFLVLLFVILWPCFIKWTNLRI